MEHWRSIRRVSGRGALPTALARAVDGGVASADEAGVSWWRAGATERATLPPVVDLEFDAAGVLWIATLDGLHRWEAGGRPTPRRLRDGDASNRVRAIATSDGALLLATDAGAYWSADGRIFQALRVGGAATPVALVAVRPARRRPYTSVRADAHTARDGLAEAWLYGSGRLSVVRGVEAAAGLRVLDVESVPLPRPAGDGAPVDLLIDRAGARALLAYDDEIAWRPLEADARDAPPPRWRRERPRLPPGAVIRRVAFAAGRTWLTTDHGVVEGETIRGPFRRTASPVGTTDCVEVRDAPPSGAVALCRSGVFALAAVGEGPDATSARATGAVGSPAESAPPNLVPSSTERSSPRRLPPDPPLEEIRRRALLRAGLTARRSHELWAGLRRRAFWPELGLRLDADFDSGWTHDRDQSFVSGDTRRLTDRSRDGGQSFGAAIEFDWDLGGVVYPEDTVDLSRELRQVVSLRDDVADEINQLYFERQAIRERLADPDGASPAEARQLYWRAGELDAGLDAWTGGWISEWRAAAGARRLDARAD